MHSKNLIWTTLKVNILSQQNIHQWEAYLFSFQMMYTYQLKQMDPYDWFCDPVTYNNKVV